MDQLLFQDIEVLPRQILFTGISPKVHVNLLRGVWGDAVMRECPAAFEAVFDGKCRGNKAERPGFSLADFGEGPSRTRQVRWTLVGQAAITHDRVLCEAWAGACRRGLGRDRIPFLPADKPLLVAASGQPFPAGAGQSWRLSEALWPLAGDPATTPCRLLFRSGLHFRQKSAVDARGRFVASPQWPRIVKSAWNRATPWLSPENREQGNAHVAEWMAIAQDTPAKGIWRGETVERWSSRQERLQRFEAAVGCLDLPAGPGPVWPLLLAAYWLGMGHHTAEGLGCFQMVVLR